jgi:hypothetical protein
MEPWPSHLPILFDGPGQGALGSLLQEFAAGQEAAPAGALQVLARQHSLELRADGLHSTNAIGSPARQGRKENMSRYLVQRIYNAGKKAGELVGAV